MQYKSRNWFRTLAFATLTAAVIAGAGCRLGPHKIDDQAKVHNDKGTKAMAERDYDKAINEFELALKLDPIAVQVQANLGYARWKRGQSERAVEELLNAKETNPDYADTYNYLGLVYADKKQWKEAEDWYKVAIDTYPNYDEAYYNLGVLYQAQNKDKDALDAYLHATQINTKYVNAHLAAGNLYFKNGILKDAQQHYELAMPDAPNAKAMSGMGKVQAKQERWEDAIRSLRKAVKLDDKLEEPKKVLTYCYQKAPDRLAKDFARSAQASYEKGKLDDCMDDLDSAEAINAKLIDTPIIRAKAFLDRKDYKGAIRESKKALAIDPRSKDARYTLSACAIADGKWKAAEELLRKLRTEEPRAVKFHVAIANVYFHEKEYRKAERELTEALKATSPAPTEAQKKQIAENMAILLRIPSFQKANQLNDEGVQAIKQGALDEAIDRFKQALEIDPQFAVAMSNASLAAIQKEDFGYARKKAEDAIALDPDLGRAHNNRGVALLRTGHGPEAKTEFQTAETLDPFDPEPTFNLGLYAFSLKKYDEAERCFLQATDVSPNHARSHFALGQLYRAKGLNDKAETRFKIAHDADSHWPAPLIELGRLSLAAGKNDEAQSLLEQAHQLDPTDPEPWAAFGDAAAAKGDKRTAMGSYLSARSCYRGRGKNDPALDMAKRAVAVVPESSEAHMALGESLDDVGRSAEAVSELRRAIDIDGTNLPAVFILGACYEKQNDWKRAAESYREVLAASPQNYFAMEKLASLYREGLDPEPVSRKDALEFAQKARKLEPDAHTQELLDKRIAELSH